MRLLCCRGRTRTGDLSQYAGRIQQVSLVDHLNYTAPLYDYYVRSIRPAPRTGLSPRPYLISCLCQGAVCLLPCYGQADVRAFTSLSYLTHVDFLP